MSSVNNTQEMSVSTTHWKMLQSKSDAIRNRPKKTHLFITIHYYYLLITKGPTGHLQSYTKTQKYNKTQWHTNDTQEECQI